MGIRTISCVVVDCDRCGTDCGNDGTPHFTSETEALHSLTGDGDDWTRTADGRWYCRGCRLALACEATGHQWEPDPPDGRYRSCARCDHIAPPAWAEHAMQEINALPVTTDPHEHSS